MDGNNPAQLSTAERVRAYIDALVTVDIRHNSAALGALAGVLSDRPIATLLAAPAARPLIGSLLQRPVPRSALPRRAVGCGDR